jgi:pyridoxal phosphate enzyme (YggS family)
MQDILENWRMVRDHMDRVARDAGRAPADVTLVCVSKTQPVEAIEPLLEAGVRVFGENRVQEAIQKWTPLREKYPDIELHLIGPLQSNKAEEAVAFFDVIETLDRPKLALTLAALRDQGHRLPRLFVELNLGGEAQKTGISARDLADFLRLCSHDHALTFDGLMCIPPQGQQASPYFAQLAGLAYAHGISGLSMGMSADYSQAIALGATHVRVGSAIFEERK